MLPVAMLASGAASLFSNGLSNLGDQFLKKADKDKSNGVSLSEFANIMQSGQNLPSSTNTPAVSTPSDSTKAKFGKVDTNTDGQLSADEVNAYNQQLVSQIQASLVQLQQQYGAGQSQHSGGHHHHKPLSDQFSAIDTNADNSITKDELTAFFTARDAEKGKTSGHDASAKAQALFDKIDTDANGTVSTAEVSAFDAARQSKKQSADTTTQDTLAQITKLLEAMQKQTSETSKKGSAAAALAAASAYKAA